MKVKPYANPIQNGTIALDKSLDKFAERPPIKNQILQTEVPYWCRPDIHTLGNVGLGGALHAAMAPLATKVKFTFHCDFVNTLNNHDSLACVYFTDN
jgi:hypothetical protein